MRRLALLFLLAGAMTASLNSCVYEETVVVHSAIPQADVFFDFWAGARNVELDGEIFNDGQTFIKAVELEISFFDEFGVLMGRDFVTIDVFIHPRQSSTFALDFSRRYVFDIDVRIVDIFI
jgi:hypothetical protein